MLENSEAQTFKTVGTGGACAAINAPGLDCEAACAGCAVANKKHACNTPHKDAAADCGWLQPPGRNVQLHREY